MMFSVVSQEADIPEDSNYITYTVSNATRLLGNSFNLNQVSQMFVNGVEITPAKTCSSTSGEVIVIFKDTLNSFAYLFDQCSDITSVDFSQFTDDGLGITSTAYMFRNCTGLTSVNLYKQFVGQSVTSTSFMFSGCGYLTTINLAGFYSATKSASRMFSGCHQLTSLTMSNFDLSKATDVSYMFYECRKLPSIDSLFQYMKPISATNMSYMFYGCTSLTSVTIAGLFKESTNISYMFSNCTSLIDVTFTNSGGNVTNAQYMFQNSEYLSKADLSGIYFAAEVDLSGMFQYCSQVQTVKFGESAEGIIVPDGAFSTATKFTTLQFPNGSSWSANTNNFNIEYY